jgi:hypothetical protein
VASVNSPSVTEAPAPPEHGAGESGSAPHLSRAGRYEILLSILIGAGFFLLLSASPDSSGGFDAYRHAKLASRLITEPKAVFADPWHLAYFWRQPVDVWFGYHMLLAPFTLVFGLVTASKVLGSIVFGALAYTLFRLLRRLEVPCRTAWVLLTLTGSSVVLCRSTEVRPFLLSVLLTFLAALFTLEDRPIGMALISALHALSYSMFFLVAAAPALWLVLRRDRRALRIALCCAGGIGVGLLLSPYFPENIRYDIVQASVVDVALRAHVLMGGELYPVRSWWWIATSLPVLALWLAAVPIRLRQLMRGNFSPGTDLLFAASVVTFAGTIRVGRTADFFVPFAMLFAACVLSPLLGNWRKDLRYIGVPLGLICAANVYLASTYVLGSPSIARFRGAAEYLRANAPRDLVANAQWGDYQFLFFWNSQTRYVVGIEPTMMYLSDPKKYWLWRHMSDDEPTTCGEEHCADSERIAIASAVRDQLGAKYVFAEHAVNPRLEKVLHQTAGVEEVYRDPAFSIFRVGS